MWIGAWNRAVEIPSNWAQLLASSKKLEHWEERRGGTGARLSEVEGLVARIPDIQSGVLIGVRKGPHLFAATSSMG